MRKNIKLVIEYDGTRYHGWQSQINALAVQDVVRKAVEKATGEACSLIGASRTDMGVHALGQTANFATNSAIPSDKFSYVLNNLLPDDIVIRKSEEVPLEFHSQYWAIGKKYRYLIYNAPFRSALMKNRACHVPYKLDFEAMRISAEDFLGKHDFAAFRAAGSTVKTSERTIHAIALVMDEDMITLEVSGDGFLYNMVRIMAGTLIDIGRGKIKAGTVLDIITSLDRTRAGKTAPAQGLYLMEVYYP